MTTRKRKPPAGMPPEGAIGGDALNRPSAKRKPRAVTPRQANRGRPTILTAEIQKAICDAIQTGNYYAAAAEYGGVSYNAFRNWMLRGMDELQRLEDNPRARPKEGEALFVDFVEAVTRAEANGEVALVASWRKHAASDWRAARDLLARRYPDRWGVTTKVEHTGAEGGPLVIEYVGDWRAKPGDANADTIDADAVPRGVIGFAAPGVPTFEDGPDDDTDDDGDDAQ